MTVDQYLVWAAEQPGRYELLDGSVLPISPEGAAHADEFIHGSRTGSAGAGTTPSWESVG